MSRFNAARSLVLITILAIVAAPSLARAQARPASAPPGPCQTRRLRIGYS